MKNALLALALFAFVGSASAHDGKDEKGKKGKKAKTEAQSHCAADAKAASASLGTVPSCCAKKGANKTAEVKTEAAPAVKSL